MTGVYLSLRVYFYQELQDNYGKYLPIYIKNKSNHIRQFLKESNKIADDLLIEIDLDDDGTLAKIHSLGTVVAKYYDADNIPSTEDLVSDVNYFLDIYNFILHNYAEKTDISVDEWIEVLSNKDVIDSKMYSILEIMNGFEDKSALSSQIAEKRKKLGFGDEKSYNSAIVSNSRRVKEYLDKKAILGEDGKEIFWMRFFYGKKLKEGFEFTLREELIEALERVNRDIGSEGVGSMSVDESYDSFYDYLIDNGYLFGKETIENYLLSLKVKPFAILTGNSGTGKTKLSQLFAQYSNSKNTDNEDESSDSKKFTASVKVGKSAINRGWAIPREDSINLIPKMKCEEQFPVLIDGVPAKGKINFNVRFFYKPEEKLVNHLNELAEKDPNQRITLELDAPAEDISNLYQDEPKKPFKEDFEYITFKTNDSRVNNEFFGLSNNFVCKVLGLDKYAEMDFYFDGLKSREHFWARTQARSYDKDLIDHLKSLDNLSDLEIKINKEDLLNTFTNPNPIEETNILFERKIGAHQNWCLPSNSFKNFLHVKNTSIWRIIIDGIEATVEFAMYSVCFSISDEELRNSFNNKDPNDVIEIKADLSTIGYYDDISEMFERYGDSIKGNSSENEYNYKIIPVGANWTENRHIVGYYNVITNEYQSTPAYDLIKEANNSTEPYFLILDEMNLSHVERYFADFLSAIESGEKIPLYGEEELTLPENLFIIGTVNVDETTYMFSPKVLDRANVIEFETYSASDYMNDNIKLSSPSGNIEYLENPLAGKEIREYGIDELREIFSDVTIDDEPFWDVLSYEINSFQTILSKSGFDFGFRVINEIVRFMAVAWEYERKPTKFDNWTRYFDACIKQKMLPKLHGSEKIIGETLEELSNSCSDSVISTEDMVKYPESFKKLEEMKKILRKQRYVSFIN